MIYKNKTDSFNIHSCKEFSYVFHFSFFYYYFFLRVFFMQYNRHYMNDCNPSFFLPLVLTYTNIHKYLSACNIQIQLNNADMLCTKHRMCIRKSILCTFLCHYIYLCRNFLRSYFFYVVTFYRK